MGFLAASDALEVGELSLVQAESGKLVVGKLGETLLVERGLEPLQGQGTAGHLREQSALRSGVVKSDLQLEDIDIC